jgi:hypothetical protein
METMKKFEFIKVAIQVSFIDRKDWVKYLTLPLYATSILEKANPEIFKTVPNEKFVSFLQNQLDSYLAGNQIDREINSAIMNCADMYACGEPITLRAGDYITLQNHFQKAGASTK